MSLDDWNSSPDNISLDTYNTNFNKGIHAIQKGILDLISRLNSIGTENHPEYNCLLDIFNQISDSDSCGNLLGLEEQLEILLNLTINFNSIENMMHAVGEINSPEILREFCESSIKILMELVHQNITIYLCEGASQIQLSYFSAINLLTKKLEKHNFWLVGHNIFDSEWLYEHGDFYQGQFLFKRFGQIVKILRAMSNKVVTDMDTENYYKQLYNQMIEQLRPSLSEN